MKSNKYILEAKNCLSNNIKFDLLKDIVGKQIYASVKYQYCPKAAVIVPWSLWSVYFEVKYDMWRRGVVGGGGEG